MDGRTPAPPFRNPGIINPPVHANKQWFPMHGFISSIHSRLVASVTARPRACKAVPQLHVRPLGEGDGLQKPILPPVGEADQPLLGRRFSPPQLGHSLPQFDFWLLCCPVLPARCVEKDAVFGIKQRLHNYASKEQPSQGGRGLPKSMHAVSQSNNPIPKSRFNQMMISRDPCNQASPNSLNCASPCLSPDP